MSSDTRTTLEWRARRPAPRRERAERPRSHHPPPRRRRRLRARGGRRSSRPQHVLSVVPSSRAFVGDPQAVRETSVRDGRRAVERRGEADGRTRDARGADSPGRSPARSSRTVADVEGISRGRGTRDDAQLEKRGRTRSRQERRDLGDAGRAGTRLESPAALESDRHRADGPAGGTPVVLHRVDRAAGEVGQGELGGRERRYLGRQHDRRARPPIAHDRHRHDGRERAVMRERDRSHDAADPRDRRVGQRARRAESPLVEPEHDFLVQGPARADRGGQHDDRDQRRHEGRRRARADVPLHLPPEHVCGGPRVPAAAGQPLPRYRGTSRMFTTRVAGRPGTSAGRNQRNHRTP